MKNLLQKQKEESFFKHTVEYVRQSAHGLKRLTTSELAYINMLLTDGIDDPWRFEAMNVKIPTGKIHQMNVITNPIAKARDIIGDAFLVAQNEGIENAVYYIYTQLVLAHVFIEANRRSAACAALWVAEVNEYNLDVFELIKFPIGDLRVQDDLIKLRDRIYKLSSRT